MTTNLRPSPRKNIGPLTTTFSAPDSCSVIDGTFSRSTGDYAGQINGKLGMQCSYNKAQDAQVFRIADDCYPDGLAAYIHDGEAWLDAPPVFEPGDVCPNGYTSACTMDRKAGDSPPTTEPGLVTASRAVWELLTVGERAIGCCPSGYTCANDDLYKCYTPGSIGQVVTGISRSDCVATTVTMTAKRFREPTILGEAQRVLLIQQRTDAGDDPTPGGGQTGITKETGTRGSTAETSSAGSGSIGNSNGGSQDSTTSPDGGGGGGGGGGGLSTNGKIAIGVTIPIVAILAGLGVLLFFMIRKKRRSRSAMAQAPMTEPKPVPPMMPGPSGTAYDRAELVGTEGRPFAELQGYNPNGVPGAYPYNTPELYGHHAQHELPPATMYETTAELPSNYRGP